MPYWRPTPGCDVVANRVFVEDAPVHSSAGVTTGIDLFLHRISAVCGPALAAQVAQGMVVALRRGPHDPELSPFLAYRNHMHPALHRVQDAVNQKPTTDWSVPTMAETAHTSPRHLTRLFLEHTGIAPCLAAICVGGHPIGRAPQHRPSSAIAAFRANLPFVTQCVKKTGGMPTVRAWGYRGPKLETACTPPTPLGGKP